MAARRTKSVTERNAKPASLPLDLDLWTTVAHALALSPQQTRIVELILRGRKDKDIAEELHLSVPTVRTYLSRIFAKLDVDDRVHLVLHVFATSQQLAANRSCPQQ